MRRAPSGSRLRDGATVAVTLAVVLAGVVTVLSVPGVAATADVTVSGAVTSGDRPDVTPTPTPSPGTTVSGAVTNDDRPDGSERNLRRGVSTRTELVVNVDGMPDDGTTDTVYVTFPGSDFAVEDVVNPVATDGDGSITVSASVVTHEGRPALEFVMENDGDGLNDYTIQLGGLSGGYVTLRGDSIGSDLPVDVDVENSAGANVDDARLTTLNVIDNTPPQNPTATSVDAGGDGYLNAAEASDVDVTVDFAGGDTGVDDTDTPEAGDVTVRLSDGRSEAGEADPASGSAPAATASTTTTVTGVDVTALEDGSVTATARIVDEASNANADGYTASSTVTLDTTPPDVTGVTIENADGGDVLAAGDTVRVAATVTDATSGVDDATVEADAAPLNGGTVALSDGDGDDVYDGTFALSSPPADGRVTGVTVSADDAAGNSNAATGGAVDVDTTGPSVSVDATQAGGDADDLVTVGDSVRVEATVSDAAGDVDSGVDAVSLDASPLGAGTVRLSRVSGDLFRGSVDVGESTAPSAPDGAVSLPVEATDGVGNDATGTGTVTLDTDAPTVTDVTLDRSGSDLDLAVRADQPLSAFGTAGTQSDDLVVQVDGPATNNWRTFRTADFTESVDGSDYVYTLDAGATPTYGDGDGFYEAAVLNARDEAGNDGGGPDVSDGFVYDTTDPTVESATLAPDNGHVDVTFSEGVSGDPSAVSPLAPDDLAATVTTGDGTVTAASVVDVTATDGSALAGGESTVRVVLDRTGAPAAGVETVAVGPADGSSVYDRAGRPVAAGDTTGPQSLADRRAPTLDAASRVDDTTVAVTLSDAGAGLDASTVDADDFALSTGAVAGVDAGALADGAASATVELALEGPVDADDLDVSLTGDGVEDLAGNEGTAGTGTATGMDGVAPALASVSRVDDTTVEATFTDGVAVDASTVAASDFALSTGTSLSSATLTGVSTTASGTTVVATLSLDAAVDAPTLEVAVDGSVADAAGNALVDGAGTATGMDGVAPPAPTVDVAPAAAGDVRVEFTDVDDASGVTYRVQRRPAGGSGSSWTTVATETADEDPPFDDADGPYVATDDGTTAGDAYDYRVLADDGENPATGSGATSVTADATPPTVAVDAVTQVGGDGDDVVATGDTVRVAATVTDANSGVDAGTVTLDAGRFGAGTLPYDSRTGDTFAWEFTVRGAPGGDGTVTPAVSAADAAGNADASAGDGVTLDTTGPAFASVTVEGADGDDVVTAGDAVRVAATVTDATDAVDAVTVDAGDLDAGASTLALSPAAGTDDYEATVVVDGTPAAADGEVSLPVTAVDGPGNERVATDDVTLDTAAPGAPPSVSATPAADGRVEVRFGDVDESGTGVARYEVLRGTAPDGPYASVATVTDDDPAGGDYRYTDAPTGDGPFYYVVRAVDGTGSASDDSNVASASTDATDPTLTDARVATTPVTDAEAGDPLAVTLAFDEPMDTAVDPTVDVTGLAGTYEDVLAGGTWTDGTTFEGTVTLADDEEDAVATLAVSGARDAAGNVMAPDATNTFPVETRTPVVTTSYGGSVAQGTVDLTAAFTVDRDDGGTTTYEYSTDGGASYDVVPDGSAWDTTAVPDGDVRVRVTDTDDVGNSDAATADVVVDNGAPPAPGGVTATAVADGEVAVAFEDVDEAAGTDVASYAVRRSPVAGGSTTTVATLPDDDAASYEVVDAGTTGGTAYRYVVAAVDGTGRESAPSAAATATADATPPAGLSVTATNPTGSTLRVAVASGEALATLETTVDGPDGSTTLTLGGSGDDAFARTGPGTYVATYDAPADGTYDATLDVAADAAGNDGATGETDATTVDSTGPTFAAVEVTGPGGAGDDVVTPGDAVRVRADVTDAEGTVAPDSVTVDASPLGGPAALALRPAGGDGYEATFDVDAPTAPDGPVRLTLAATDGDGNGATRSGPATAVTLDTAGPRLSAVSVTDAGGDDTLAPGERVRVAADVTDATSAVDAGTVTVDASPLGGPASLALADGDGDDRYEAAFDPTLPATDGRVTLALAAADDQGLSTTAEAAATVDTTPPSVTGVVATQANGDDTVNVGDTVRVAATVSDATGAVAPGSVTVDAAALDAGTVALTDGDDDGVFDASFVVGDGPGPDGDVTLAVTAADDQGLVGTGSAVVALDTTAPADPTATAFASSRVTGATTVDVQFPAPPEAGTVTVEVTDGNTSVRARAPADPTSATTAVPVDVGSLSDGELTARATLVDDGDNRNPAGLTAASTARKSSPTSGGSSDTVRPSLASVTGLDGPITDDDAGAERTVRLEFDERMDTGAAPVVAVRGLSRSYVLDGAWVDDRTFELDVTFADDDETATARLLVGGAADVAGNVMRTDESHTFAVDTENPSVNTTLDGATLRGSVDLAAGVTVADADGGTTVYEYSTDGGETFERVADPAAWNASVLPAGPATLRFVHTDAVGNRGVATASVTVAAESSPPADEPSPPDDDVAPTADAGANRTASPNETVRFDAGNSSDDVGIVAYEWSFGDGTTATGPTPTHAYPNAGTYTVTLTVRDAAGNADVDRLAVTVAAESSPPADDVAPTADAGANRTASPNETVRFDAGDSGDDVGIVAYEWSFGDGTTATGPTPTHAYPDTGAYTATLTVRDAAGNADVDRLTVSVCPAVDGGRTASLDSDVLCEDLDDDGDVDFDDSFRLAFDVVLAERSGPDPVHFDFDADGDIDIDDVFEHAFYLLDDDPIGTV
jgi:hypothetical protein